MGVLIIFAIQPLHPSKGGIPTNVEVLGRWNTKHEHLVSMLREQGR